MGMSLSDIEAKADELAAALDGAGAALAKDLTTKLEGLAYAATIKRVVDDRATWNVSVGLRERELAAMEQVAEATKTKMYSPGDPWPSDLLIPEPNPEPTKPAVDRLHDLLSIWNGFSEDQQRTRQFDTRSLEDKGYAQGQAVAWGKAASMLQEILQEGGL